MQSLSQRSLFRSFTRWHRCAWNGLSESSINHFVAFSYSGSGPSNQTGSPVGQMKVKSLLGLGSDSPNGLGQRYYHSPPIHKTLPTFLISSCPSLPYVFGLYSSTKRCIVFLSLCGYAVHNPLSNCNTARSPIQSLAIILRCGLLVP